VSTYTDTYDTTGAAAPTQVHLKVTADGVDSNIVIVDIEAVVVPTPTLILALDPTDQVEVGDPIQVTVLADIDPPDPVTLSHTVNMGPAIDDGPMTETTPRSFSFSFDTTGLVDGDVVEFHASTTDEDSNYDDVLIVAAPVVVLTLTTVPTGSIVQGQSLVIDVNANIDPDDPVVLLYSFGGDPAVTVGEMPELAPTHWRESVDTDTTFTPGNYEYWATDGTVESNHVTVALTAALPPVPVLTLTTDDADGRVMLGTPVEVTVISDINPVSPVALHYSLNGGAQVDVGNMTEKSPTSWEDTADTSALIVGDEYELWATADGGESNHVTVTLVTLTLLLSLNDDSIVLAESVEAEVTATANPFNPVNLWHSLDGGVLWDDLGAMTEETVIRFEQNVTPDVTGTHTYQARSGTAVSNNVDLEVLDPPTTVTTLTLESPDDVRISDSGFTVLATADVAPTNPVNLWQTIDAGTTWTDLGPMDVTANDKVFQKEIDPSTYATNVPITFQARTDDVVSNDKIVTIWPVLTTLVLTADPTTQIVGQPVMLTATTDGLPIAPPTLFQRRENFSSWLNVGLMTPTGPNTWEWEWDTTGFDAEEWGFYAATGTLTTISTPTVVLLEYATRVLTLTVDPNVDVLPGENLTANLVTSEAAVSGTANLWYQAGAEPWFDLGPMSQAGDPMAWYDTVQTTSAVAGDVWQYKGIAETEESNIVTVTFGANPFATFTSDVADVAPGDPVTLTATLTAPATGEGPHVFVEVTGAAPLAGTDLGVMTSADGGTTWTLAVATDTYADGDTLDFHAEFEGASSPTVTVTVEVPAVEISLPVLDPASPVPDNTASVLVTVTSTPPLAAVSLFHHRNAEATINNPMTTTDGGTTWTVTADISSAVEGDTWTFWGRDAGSAVSGPQTVLDIIATPLALTLTAPDTAELFTTFEVTATATVDPADPVNLWLSKDAGTTYTDLGAMTSVDATNFSFSLDTTSGYTGADTLTLQARAGATVSNTTTTPLTQSWINAPTTEPPGPELPDAGDIAVTLTDTIGLNSAETITVQVKINDDAPIAIPMTFIETFLWEGTIPDGTFTDGDVVEMWGHVEAGNQRGPSANFTVAAPLTLTITLTPEWIVVGDTYTVDIVASRDPADPVEVQLSSDDGTTWQDAPPVTEVTPTTFTMTQDTDTWSPNDGVLVRAIAGAVISNEVTLVVSVPLTTLTLTADTLAPPIGNPVVFTATGDGGTSEPVILQHSTNGGASFVDDGEMVATSGATFEFTVDTTGLPDTPVYYQAVSGEVTSSAIVLNTEPPSSLTSVTPATAPNDVATDYTAVGVGLAGTANVARRFQDGDGSWGIIGAPGNLTDTGFTWRAQHSGPNVIDIAALDANGYHLAEIIGAITIEGPPPAPVLTSVTPGTADTDVTTTFTVVGERLTLADADGFALVEQGVASVPFTPLGLTDTGFTFEWTPTDGQTGAWDVVIEHAGDPIGLSQAIIVSIPDPAGPLGTLAAIPDVWKDGDTNNMAQVTGGTTDYTTPVTLWATVNGAAPLDMGEMFHVGPGVPIWSSAVPINLVTLGWNEGDQITLEAILDADDTIRSGIVSLVVQPPPPFRWGSMVTLPEQPLAPGEATTIRQTIDGDGSSLTGVELHILPQGGNPATPINMIEVSEDVWEAGVPSEFLGTGTIYYSTIGQPGDIQGGQLTVTRVSGDPVLPVLTSVAPSAVDTNVPTTFTVVGTDLTRASTFRLYVGGLDKYGIIPTGLTDTGFTFDFTIPAPAVYALVARDAGGAEIARLDAAITVTDPPPPGIYSVTPTAVTPTETATFTVVGKGLGATTTGRFRNVDSGVYRSAPASNVTDTGFTFSVAIAAGTWDLRAIDAGDNTLYELPAAVTSAAADLTGWTVAELRQFAADHEPPIYIPSSAKKADIITLITDALSADSTEEN
jgi:hypothetical protein